MITPSRIRKGLQNPEQILSYLCNRFDDRYHAGRVTFAFGTFVTSPDNQIEYASKLYREASTIQKLLQEHTTSPARGLEVGCGYARLTPWLDTVTENVIGVDINKDILPETQQQHPELSFLNCAADSLPFQDDTFDVVMAWTVLHHIPPELIKPSCREINRILVDNGTLLICEKTRGDGSAYVWSRTAEEYESFLDRTLVTTNPKPVEPGWLDKNDVSEITAETMLFT